MSLVLALRLEESIWVGEAKITLIKIGEECKLAFDAPRSVKIVRDEVLRREAERKEPANAKP